MNVNEFLDYLKEAKSKSTFNIYKYGIEAFVKWYGKDADTILKERFEDLQSSDQNTRKRFNREIEKFHRHLKNEGFSQNSAVSYTEGIRGLFRFYDMDVKDLPSEVTHKTVTVKDYVPTVSEYRDMFNCGNLLDRVIISEALDLGWRVGDFVSQKKEALSLDRETPIPYDLITEKEEVISKSFLSQQSVDLLKTYVRTLPEDNPYLFPNGNEGHLNGDSINKRLKALAKKAKIHIPKGKRIRFHAFRKKVFSECANLKIDVNTAKILVGKSVSADMLAYLSEVEHKNAFEEVHARLRLTEAKAVVNAKNAEIEALKKRVEELEIMNKGLVEMVKQLGITKETARDEDYIKSYKRSITQIGLEKVIKQLGKQAIEREQEEYQKLIEENNNNNNK